MCAHVVCICVQSDYGAVQFISMKGAGADLFANYFAILIHLFRKNSGVCLKYYRIPHTARAGRNNFSKAEIPLIKQRFSAWSTFDMSSKQRRRLDVCNAEGRELIVFLSRSRLLRPPLALLLLFNLILNGLQTFICVFQAWLLYLIHFCCRRQWTKCFAIQQQTQKHISRELVGVCARSAQHRIRFTRSARNVTH